MARGHKPLAIRRQLEGQEGGDVAIVDVEPLEAFDHREDGPLDQLGGVGGGSRSSRSGPNRGMNMAAGLPRSGT